VDALPGCFEPRQRRQLRERAMADREDDCPKYILAELEKDSRVDLHSNPIRVHWQDEVLVLDGTVDSIAAKRIAREAAHRRADPAPVLDRLRVRAAEREGSGQLKDEVVNLLLGEPVFRSSSIYLRRGDTLETLREVRTEWGEYRIEIEIDDATVILSGEVLSLSHRRMAEVLAWWSRGCERVENLLHVFPPEQETDDELADGIRLVLEKDPLVASEQVIIHAHDGVVILDGIVANEEERRLAVQDAWYVPGVKDVVDELQVYG
jgi:osmotically-inducible protein OsmY